MMTLALSAAERRREPAYGRWRDEILGAILNAAAETYDVSRKRILAPDRSMVVAAARNVAMFIAHEFGFSLHECGAFFKRDHSTIYMAHLRASERIAQDELYHVTCSLVAKRAGLI